MAAYDGHTGICSLLLEKGADMAAKNNVSDAADRDIHMPHPIHRIVCTYSHTYTSPPTSYPNLQTYITFRGVYSLLPPPLSRPVPPHPLLPSLYGRQQRIVSCRCPLLSMGGYVCMQAWLCGDMYVCMQKEEVAAFSLFRASFHRPIDRGAASRSII